MAQASPMPVGTGSLPHPSCTEHRASLPITAGSALLSHPGKEADRDPGLLILLSPSSSPWAPHGMSHLQPWAVLVWISISQWPLQSQSPCPWGQRHSPHTDPIWFSLFINISKRDLISFPWRKLSWPSSNRAWTNKNFKIIPLRSFWLYTGKTGIRLYDQGRQLNCVS